MIVRNCKTCGPLTEEEAYKNRKCKVCERKKSLIRSRNNQSRRKETNEKWKKDHPDRIKAYRDKYNTNNKDKKIKLDRVYGKKSYIKNKEKVIKRTGERLKVERENLSDHYVKTKLKIKHKIPIKEIPQWMVDLKRNIMKLRRGIRDKNDSKDM